MRPRASALRVALPLLAALLAGFDWPGRAAALEAQLRSAAPERRREALLEAASARDPTARALVLRALDDAADPVRLAAAALAARLGLTEAAPRLVAWLDRPDVASRLAAARALGELRAEAAFAPLQRALTDADVNVRLAAVSAVAAIAGRNATVALLDRVSDDESNVRVEAIRALGDLGDPRAVLSLLGSLQDAIPEVRAAGAHALGSIGDPRAQRALVAAFRDPVWDVRHAAVRAVGALGERAPEAVADLAAVALRESREADPAAWARLAVVAVQSLARVGTPAAVEVIVQVARRAGDFVDRAPAREALHVLPTLGDRARARVSALEDGLPPELDGELFNALGRLGGDDAARVLLRRLERPNLTPGVRSLALVALGQTGSREALLPLLARAGSPVAESLSFREFDRGDGCSERRLDPSALTGLSALLLRRGSLGAESLDLLVALGERAAGGCEAQSVSVLSLLGHTENPRAAAAVTPSLRHPSPALRAAAARALATLDLQGAEPALLDALRDPAPAVRAAAADALARRASPAALPAMLARWDDPAPVDRVALARALGRTARRSPDVALHHRTHAALTACARQSAPVLAGACVDALADLAAAGVTPADATLLALAEGPRRALRPALAEALANAVALSLDARADVLRASLAGLARVDPALRPAQAWAAGEGSGDVPWLLEALRDPDFAVVANAAASLGRLAARGRPVDAGEALCAILAAWRHPVVVANALRALASLRGGACAAATVSRALAHHPETLVREAALAAARARPDDPVLVAAVLRCAAADRSPAVAEACRRPATAAPAAPRDGAIDAAVMDAAGDALEATPVALLLPDRWVRVMVTGPGGWIHARPSATGEFVVLAPDELAPDAP